MRPHAEISAKKGSDEKDNRLIIIIGGARAWPETLDALLALSLEHVHRSRLEPGCLSHDVHIDAEDPLRLVFVEAWSDRDAVNAHFAVPESGAFVRAARELTQEAPHIHLYEATPVT
jgi:quinol monooxygenase YgiN